MNKWQLKNKSVPYLELDVKGKVHFYCSTRHGVSFLKEKGVEKIVYLRQVRGAKVFVFKNSLKEIEPVNLDKIDAPSPLFGDGLLTDIKELAIGVRIADCYPVFITSSDVSFVGILHTGWRGLKEGILERGLTLIFKNWSIPPSEILIALGPGISEEHYEVGEEFLEYFPGNLKMKDGHYYLGIERLIEKKLVDFGLEGSNIIGSPFCTFEREDLFHSRRREGPRHGNQWGVAVISSSVPEKE